MTLSSCALGLGMYMGMPILKTNCDDVKSMVSFLLNCVPVDELIHGKGTAVELGRQHLAGLLLHGLVESESLLKTA